MRSYAGVLIVGNDAPYSRRRQYPVRCLTNYLTSPALCTDCMEFKLRSTVEREGDGHGGVGENTSLMCDFRIARPRFSGHPLFFARHLRQRSQRTSLTGTTPSSRTSGRVLIWQRDSAAYARGERRLWRIAFLRSPRSHRRVSGLSTASAFYPTPPPINFRLSQGELGRK